MPYGLEQIGLNPAGEVLRNLPLERLMADTLEFDGGAPGPEGAIMVDTGIYTGRSPMDRFIVDEPSSADKIWWGPENRKVSEEVFGHLLQKVLDHYNVKSGNRNIYIFDGRVGADPKYALNVRIVAQKAWQAFFCRNMFINLAPEELERFTPGFTIINASEVVNEQWAAHGLNSETFILIHLGRRLAIIGGTEYTGEMKKGIFSVMNYFLPLKNVLTMHCSANVDRQGAHPALFFGLSGTGKTTLSTDPDRLLVGDDEHGWSDEGLLNFEGGCYAKVINLDKEAEPDIYNAIRAGALLENVVYDSETYTVDYSDASKTENTRVSYPLDHIANSLVAAGKPSVTGHPDTIIFLTADAYGIMPPVSRLNMDQAMYHFISGYTAKVAGTERGVTEPQATFSPCFGGPFLPLPPLLYAELLKEKIELSGARVYLVNTGWSGGSAAHGAKRISIQTTRSIISAILSGLIENATFEEDPIFGTAVPDKLPGVDSGLLHPRTTWQDGNLYDETAHMLAEKFDLNFRQYAADHGELLEAGPKIFV